MLQFMKVFFSYSCLLLCSYVVKVYEYSLVSWQFIEIWFFVIFLKLTAKVCDPHDKWAVNQIIVEKKLIGYVTNLKVAICWSRWNHVQIIICLLISKRQRISFKRISMKHSKYRSICREWKAHTTHFNQDKWSNWSESIGKCGIFRLNAKSVDGSSTDCLLAFNVSNKTD